MSRVSESRARRLHALVRASRSVFITGHVRPDGDTVGSALALGHVLRRGGARVVDIVMQEPCPETFAFLPGCSRIRSAHRVEGSYDLGIILECADVSRMGGIIDLARLRRTVALDHHEMRAGASDRVRFDLALVYPSYASCAEIVYDLLVWWGEPVSRAVAQCLYTGIVTDTGRFQWSNTDEHTLTTAAALVRIGVRPLDMFRRLYGNRDPRVLVLLGKVLGTLTVVQTGGLRVTHLSVTRLMFEQTGAGPADTEGFIDYAVSVAGTDVALFFREDDRGSVKVSFRSHRVNVERVARWFGGGGHRYASGATVPGPLSRAVRVVLAALRKAGSRIGRDV